MPRTRPAKLSEKEKAVLRAVIHLCDQSAYLPTIREIGERAKISSPSQVRYYLLSMEQKGLIEREPGVPRSTRPTRRALPAPSIPLAPHIPILGRIQAGEPILIPASDLPLFDDESYIELSEKMLPRSADRLFALEVGGDSMRDALVDEGDIVILRATAQAENGDMVAAWIKDKNETTLKRYYLEGSQVTLQPANPAFQPIHLNAREVDVQGVVVFVLRQL